MNSLIAHCESAYRSAELVKNPFPHYVVDNFLPPETFAELVNSGLAQQALLKRTPDSGRMRTWSNGTICVPMHPLGKFQLPDLTGQAPETARHLRLAVCAVLAVRSLLQVEHRKSIEKA